MNTTASEADRNAATVGVKEFPQAALLLMRHPTSFQRVVAHGDHVVFEFAMGADIEKTIEEYVRGAALVEPRGYFQRVRVLKTMLHEARG